MDLSSSNRWTVSLTPASASPRASGEHASERAEMLDALVERLAAELRGRWAQGDRPLVEEFFARHPELMADTATAIDLVYEEVCLREQAGQKGAWEDAFQRFPRWQTSLETLRDCHRLLQPAQAGPRFPVVGEMLGEFHLLAELGQGARGRVFLATQPALADRPVVLKVTPRQGHEHLSLARLQHTNIVPLYTAQDDPARQLRLLCMPYLGNATLSRLLDALATVPLARRTGEGLVTALEGLQHSLPLSPAPAAAPKQLLARASYVQAVCWIGACCADALQYAHERGLVHLDLKPSNVLVAADGQPLLLDFHLAHEPLQPDRPPPDELGGTFAYMPPEQHAAVEAVGEGRPVPSAVDGRADLYALGAVLFEALGGRVPLRPPEPAPLWRCNPQVSVGLSDIIARCLATHPDQRYADAAALAADLRRHLTNQPLQGVSNRSLVERWQKWRKRRPTALRRALLGLVLLGLALVFAAGVWFHLADRYDEAERTLRNGQKQYKQRTYREAVATLRHGLARVENFPFRSNLVWQLRDQLRQAEEALDKFHREQLVGNLHQHVEQLRMLLALEDVPSSRLRGLEAPARALWEKRTMIRKRLAHSPGASAADNDLLDLAVCRADLCVRLAAPREVPAARRRALEVLAEAEQLFGSQAVLEQERQLQQRALGLAPAEVPPPALPVPRTVGERNALGRSLLRSGQLQQALEVLDQACGLEPHNLWSNYYYGLCAYRLKRYEGAALAFSVCVGVAPDLAGCHYSRGLALAALGRTDEAVRAYNRALQLDSTLACAALNRGMLHYQMARYDRALTDLHQALAGGASPATVYYDLALVHGMRHEPAAARDCVERALQHDPYHEEATRLREQLRTDR